MASANVYSPDYDSNGNPKPGIPELKDAIEEARADIEKFATATTSFTDIDGNTIEKGAKGFALDASDEADRAETAESGAESARNAAQLAESDAESARDDAQLARDNARGARDDALLAESGAQSAESGAVSAKDDAEAAATNLGRFSSIDGQVQSVAGLPSASNNSGDLYFVRDETDYYLSDGSQWVAQDLGLVPQVVLERRFLDVKEAGAKGDGSTDDQGAINQAASDVAAGGELYVPPGTYNMTAALSFNKGLSIRFATGASFRVDPSVDGEQTLIAVGDGATKLEGIEIINPNLDGNKSNRSGSPTVSGQLLYIQGPLEQVYIRNPHLFDHYGGGLNVLGVSETDRGEQLVVENFDIHDLGEGIRFTHFDQCEFRNGRIVNMTSQDGFEPLEGTKDWLLENTYITGPGPDNNIVDIYPGGPGGTSGRMIGCHFEGSLVRVAVGSDEQTNPSAVDDLIVRDCFFDGCSLRGPDNGQWTRATVEDNHFAGPSGGNTRLQVFHGIGIGPSRRAEISGNKVHGYQGRGIECAAPDEGEIFKNEVYNNGQDTSRSNSQRVGIAAGAGFLVAFNKVYDDQSTQTQVAAIRRNHGDIDYVANDLRPHSAQGVFFGQSQSGERFIANKGGPSKATGLVTIPSGSTQSSTPIENVQGDGLNDPTDNVTLTFAEDPGNASTVWAYTSGGGNAVFARVDQDPGKDLEIAYHVDYDYEQMV